MTRKTMLASLFFFWTAVLQQYVSADIIMENLPIRPEDIFDFIVLQDSGQFWLEANVTQYFCIMRGLWNPWNHPKKFPALARMSNPIVYSSTKEYLPWLLERKVTLGIEKIAETGFTDTFKTETEAAGKIVYDLQEGKGFFVNQEDPEKNYAYLPGVKVTPDFPFLSGVSSMMPSPDWFTGFYLLVVIDEYDRTFWNRILIHTYPWDSGTDGGNTYLAVDEDLDPPVNIQRINVGNAPGNGIFKSPDGRTIRPVAEWDCVLHVCGEGEKECHPENWPPENGCDILKYNGCHLECDPLVDEICEECKPKPKPIKLGKKVDESAATKKVFYKNCCQSNHEPLSGYKCATGKAGPQGTNNHNETGGGKTKVECNFWRPLKCLQAKKGAASSHFSLFTTLAAMSMGLVALLL